ncbi:protein MCM10 homolog [Cephus cinctus]|uniref:Protein MCM10 homolog n=1 Tax=Cephus cinctus TaxID=211228 RepID=A0AAJ7FMG9_CEPCN|nr:protein MCM10 homolog [Cephus cinctus]XP_024942621.1 protein MCM10 homolog [Cephus cinctus]
MDDDSDNDLGDILDNLLANDEESKDDINCDKGDTQKSTLTTAKSSLKELEFSFLDCVSPSKDESKSPKKSIGLVHQGDTDSSDDEGKRYFDKQKYSESGHSVKSLLKNQAFEKEDRGGPLQESNKTFDLSKRKSFIANAKREPFDFNKTGPTNTPSTSTDVYTDPIFGLRIVKPLVSSAELKERMVNRTPVPLSKVKNFVKTGNVNSDWVIAGVLTNKLPPKTSQKGKQYCIWKLSDLTDAMNTISLFLFGNAYKLMWKTSTGSVIGVLNPGVFDDDSKTDQAALSIDNPQKMMILGNSKDLGTCKSMKKNGEPCTSIVNKNRCEYCIYHVKREYKKCSKRTELQSDFNNRGFSMDALKKTASRSGLNSFSEKNMTLVPAKRNQKLHDKDCARLALLKSDVSLSEKKVHVMDNEQENKKKSYMVERTTNQAKKDLDRLSKLRAWGSTQTPMLEKANGFGTPETKLINDKVKNKSNENIGLSKLSALSIPKLGNGISGGVIDFSEPIAKKHMDLAKMNALKWVREKGSFKKSNPNKVRMTKDEKIEKVTKRRREDEEDEEKQDIRKVKKSNVLSDKFQEMIKATSAHTDLIEKSRDEEQEKYFNKLEVKEKMEEKMMSTYQVDCKAVKCLICKYTAFSSSDMCKEQRHPLRVIDAVKRFFKCSDCGNRTVSLDRIPSRSCQKCSSSNWMRAAMMDNKRIQIPGTSLSIRGGEEKFLGSAMKDANLDLLVPEVN